MSKPNQLKTRNRPNRDMPVRLLPIESSNIRFSSGKSPKAAYQFTGYAVKWDSVNTYGEQFARGAFTDLVAAVNAGTKSVYMYYNHGWREFIDTPIRRRVGKWVKLEEDDTGLKVTGELTAGLSIAEDLKAMMAHGTVDGLSICFYPVSPMDYEEQADRIIIKRADLYEISVVDEPSDRDARTDTQNIEQMESEADATRMLHSLGLSEEQARSFIGKLDDVLHPTPQADVEAMRSVADILDFGV